MASDSQYELCNPRGTCQIARSTRFLVLERLRVDTGQGHLDSVRAADEVSGARMGVDRSGSFKCEIVMFRLCKNHITYCATGGGLRNALWLVHSTRIPTGSFQNAPSFSRIITSSGRLDCVHDRFIISRGGPSLNGMSHIPLGRSFLCSYDLTSTRPY